MSFKRFFQFGFLFCLIFQAAVVSADSNYIYRQRINWVKVDKASSKVVAPGTVKHPFSNVTVEQMEGMLLSIKISKRYLLKKEIDSVDVFNSYEARKYAPFIVEGLAKAGSDQIVNFSIIHKRPFFILRNDRLTMGNVWVADDGLHFQFPKLFAKMTGDYEASANMDKAIRNAKTLRVTLEANQGQKLSYNSATEIILDPAYDFATQAAQEQQAEALAEKEEMKGKKAKKEEKKQEAQITAAPPPPPSSTPPPPPTVSQKSATPTAATTAAPATTSGDAADRLRQLDELKKQKLISEQEYQQKRKEILSEI